MIFLDLKEQSFPAAPVLDNNYFSGWVLHLSDLEQARLKGVMPDDEVTEWPEGQMAWEYHTPAPHTSLGSHGNKV